LQYDIIQNANDRKIGTNEVVLKAIEKIKGAQHYYFVAVLPLDIQSADFQKKFKELKWNIPIKNIQCVFWGDIDNFFKDSVTVRETFEYNKGQIYRVN
jgi:hypothetical protein